MVDLDVFIYEFFVKIVKTIILRNHANTARNQGIFRENEQDHSFITDSTRDNEAQFYCRKAGDNLYFSIPPPPPPPPHTHTHTHKNTYIAGYQLTTDDECSVHYGHIWAVLWPLYKASSVYASSVKTSTNLNQPLRWRNLEFWAES